MSRAREAARLVGNNTFTIDSSNNVGLASTSPSSKLNVSGIVSATSYYGDGSNLEGVASAGLGTALADTGAGAVIYYTDATLVVDSTTTVDVPDASSSNVAYTQYAEVSVDSGSDLIIADGDDFIPDILGITTDGPVGALAGGGRIRVDNISSKSGSGSVYFNAGVDITGVGTFAGITTADTQGLRVAGIVTASSFVGDGSSLTGTVSTGKAIAMSMIFG
tara:strand:- start:3000 stop:3659 length:660 start_codon:yes stop_codon:yes gene_type:complete